jgi:hypothetical protein
VISDDAPLFSINSWDATQLRASLDPVYLPTNNRIPANNARTPIACEGIGRRIRDDSPVRMSQSAKSSMPIDTTPIVI